MTRTLLEKSPRAGTKSPAMPSDVENTFRTSTSSTSVRRALAPTAQES
jgi:hypothetical protein